MSSPSSPKALVFKSQPNAGARNLIPDAPPDLTDTLITIFVPAAALKDPESPEPEDDVIRGLELPWQRSWFKRHFTGSHEKRNMFPVRMRKSEFLGYFARDEATGKYRDGVVQPPGGRREWLKRRLADQESWKPIRANYEGGSSPITTISLGAGRAGGGPFAGSLMGGTTIP